MNNDEIMSLTRKLLVMALTAVATKLHLDQSQVPAIAADLADLGVIIWGVAAHWNMVKVPEPQGASK